MVSRYGIGPPWPETVENAMGVCKLQRPHIINYTNHALIDSILNTGPRPVVKTPKKTNFSAVSAYLPHTS